MNNLYGCGLNKAGQLGLDHYDNIRNFTKIDTSFIENDDYIKYVS